MKINKKKLIKGWKYKVILHKNYFDKGRSITAYFIYMIAIFGFASRNVKASLIIGFIYAIACYFFGMWWFHYGLVFAENEVGNQNDLFEQEVRVVMKWARKEKI